MVIGFVVIKLRWLTASSIFGNITFFKSAHVGPWLSQARAEDS